MMKSISHRFGLLAIMFFLGCHVCYSAGSATPKKIKKETQEGFLPGGNGSLVSDSSRTIITYDMNGNVLDETEWSLWPQYQKMVAYTKKNFYDSSGKVDSTVIFIDGKYSLKLEYGYDAEGKEMFIQEINSERQPSFRSTNTYNELDQKIRTNMSDPRGKPYNVKLYNYDKRGNLVDESGSETGEPRYRWIYKYDRKNRLIERKDYSGTGAFLRKHKYDYSKEGKTTKETVTTQNGQVERIVKYRYEYY